MQQSRFADLSLFHSAVDEVLAKAQAAKGAPIGRPDPSHESVQAAAAVTQMAESLGLLNADASALQTPLPLPPPQAATAPNSTASSQTGAAVAPGSGKPAAIAEVAVCNANPVTYCASLARNLALAKLAGREDLVAQYFALLNQKMGVCDPHWIEAAVKYAEFVACRGKIPYVKWQNIGDFVLQGKLPSNARVAIVGDWGTGQPEARAVLEQIARKKPHVVIHLGDIYYSATEFEVENYFYNIWREVLNLPASNISTFTLAGNHDMFCGGVPYYKLIQKLEQPASYFCLRNDDWQFVAVDTGLHDSKPDGTTPTYLEDTEVAWLKDKMASAGKRRTILLSHHQLFSAFEGICGKSVNETLYGQVKDILPNVAVWLWGHEHNQVIYENYKGVLGRCIGHGAFPIAKDQIPATPKFPEVPVKKNVQLGGDPFFDHGYVLVELNGPQAAVS